MWWQQDKKTDGAVTGLSVELDRGGDGWSPRYRPGGEVRGRVTFSVWQATEMTQLVVWIHGQGKLQLASTSGTESVGKTEQYLKHRLVLMGSIDDNKSLILQPGPYRVDFTYRLPVDLPPTVNYENRGRYTVTIEYKVTAEICDKVGRLNRPLPAEVGSHSLTTTKTIAVCDRTVATDQQVPVSMAESVGDRTGATLRGTVDKSHYRLGETVSVHLLMSGQPTASWKRVKLEMKQIAKTRDDKIISTVASSDDYLPDNEPSYRGNLQIPADTIHCRLGPCRIVNVTYFLKATVEFAGDAGHVGGHVVRMKFPLDVLPSEDQPAVPPSPGFELVGRHLGTCKLTALHNQDSKKLSQEAQRQIFFDKDRPLPRHRNESSLTEWLAKVSRLKVGEGADTSG